MKKLFALVVLLASVAAFADPIIVPNTNIERLDELSAGSVASDDLILIYDNSADKIKKLDASASPLGGLPSSAVLTSTTTATALVSGGVYSLDSPTEFDVTLPLVASVSNGWNVTFFVGRNASGANYRILTGADAASMVGNVTVASGVTTSITTRYASGQQARLVGTPSTAARVGDMFRATKIDPYWYIEGISGAKGGITLH